jgi:hypothetical protein
VKTWQRAVASGGVGRSRASLVLGLVDLHTLVDIASRPLGGRSWVHEAIVGRGGLHRGGDVATGTVPCRVGGWEIRGMAGDPSQAREWGWVVVVVHPMRWSWGCNDGENDGYVAVVVCCSGCPCARGQGEVVVGTH